MCFLFLNLNLHIVTSYFLLYAYVYNFRFSTKLSLGGNITVNFVFLKDRKFPEYSNSSDSSVHQDLWKFFFYKIKKNVKAHTKSYKKEDIYFF